MEFPIINFNKPRWWDDLPEPHHLHHAIRNIASRQPEVYRQPEVEIISWDWLERKKLDKKMGKKTKFLDFLNEEIIMLNWEETIEAKYREEMDKI